MRPPCRAGHGGVRPASALLLILGLVTGPPGLAAEEARWREAPESLRPVLEELESGASRLIGVEPSSSDFERGGSDSYGYLGLPLLDSGRHGYRAVVQWQLPAVDERGEPLPAGSSRREGYGWSFFELNLVELEEPRPEIDAVSMMADRRLTEAIHALQMEAFWLNYRLVHGGGEIPEDRSARLETISRQQASLEAEQLRRQADVYYHSAEREARRLESQASRKEVESARHPGGVASHLEQAERYRRQAAEQLAQAELARQRGYEKAAVKEAGPQPAPAPAPPEDSRWARARPVSPRRAAQVYLSFHPGPSRLWSSVLSTPHGSGVVFETESLARSGRRSWDAYWSCGRFAASLRLGIERPVLAFAERYDGDHVWVPFKDRRLATAAAVRELAEEILDRSGLCRELQLAVSWAPDVESEVVPAGEREPLIAHLPSPGEELAIRIRIEALDERGQPFAGVQHLLLQLAGPLSRHARIVGARSTPLPGRYRVVGQAVAEVLLLVRATPELTRLLYDPATWSDPARLQAAGLTVRIGAKLGAVAPPA